MLQTNKKRVIQDVASLPTIGNSKYIYHNTTDGFFYYWNDVTSSYVELKNLNVLTTAQPPPTATGNTNNLNSVFKDASGDTWIVDSNGDSVKAGSSFTAFKHQKEWHVDKNGNDTTGTGAEDNPYLTVAKALTLAGSTGEKVVVHPGTYAENITVTQLNLDIVGSHGTVSGISYINGTITVAGNGTASSVRLSNLMTDNVVHTGTVRLVSENLNVKTSLTKSGTGTVNCFNSFLVGVSITGTGQCNFYDGDISGLNVNNAGAIVSISKVNSLVSATITSGICGINYTTIFATSSAGTALTASAGTTVIVKNSGAYDSLGVATKITLSGLYSIDNVYFNKTDSTLGTNLGQVHWFDNIGLINVPTITTATKALVRDANGIVSEQLFPTGGALNYSGTATPSATGNTAASLGIASLPANYRNTTTGIVTYIDTNGVATAVEGSKVYTQTVYFNAVNPTTATIFSLENPPLVNDNSLKNLDNAIYIGTDGSTWNSNGTTYGTYIAAPATEWFLAGTTTDAGSNKLNTIAREGWVTVGQNIAPNSALDVYRTTSSAYSTVLRMLNPSNKVIGNSTQFVFGASQEAGNCADIRFYYAGDNSINSRIDFSFSGLASPVVVFTPNSRVGINQPAPAYNLDVNGTARIVTTPTITTATKALVKDPTTGQISEQTFPTGGGSSAAWTSVTTDPTATGNTGTLPRFVENTANSTKWYIDSTGVAKLIESSKVFAQVVYVNDLPSSATIFSLENPPVTNDNSLKNLDSALYVVVSSDPSKNGQTWTSNGTTYSTYIVVAGTPFNLANSSVDAGSNKTSAIERSGSMSITDGFIQVVNQSNQNAFTMDPKDTVGPKMKWGTTSNASQYLDMGAYNSQNNVDSKTRKFQIFNTANANAFTMDSSNGWIGISTGSPLSTLDTAGSFGTNIVKPPGSSYTQLSTDRTIVMQTSGSNVVLLSSILRREIRIKNGSTGNITFTGHIDNVGNTTFTIPSAQSRTLHGDGTTWWIV